MSIGAGMRGVEQEQVEEWSCGIGVDTGWKEWLRSEADRAIRNRRSRRHAWHVLRIDRRAGKVDYVSCFRDSNVGRENRCVRHAIQREKIAVKICDRKDEACWRTIGQAN